jgi:hypothetical protein
MADIFPDSGDSLIAPARQCFAITPHDSNPVSPLPKAVRAVGAGVIKLRAVDSGSDVTHPVVDGERIDVRVLYVRATGTTVSLIGYA